MRTIIILLFLTIFCLQIASVVQADESQVIGVTVPVSVVREAVAEVVPLQIEVDSKLLFGLVTINNITNIIMQDGRVFATLDLSGDNMKISTKLGGHTISLDVGNVSVVFDCSAKMRFDQKTQIVYITPWMSEKEKVEGQKKQDVGALLMSAFHGREFPIKLDRFPPYIFLAANKSVEVGIRVSDVVIGDNVLLLYFQPTFFDTEK